jgi:O-antigen/teichoic acid export membrane protein
MSTLTARPRRVGSNIVYSGLGRLWSALLLLVTVPVVVHGIGTSAYGVFALVSVILGYVAFLDFGLTASVVRSVSRHHSSGDHDALQGAVGTAFTLLILLGAGGALLIFAVSPLVADRVLHIPGSLRDDAIFAFRVAGLGFGLNMILVVFAGIVQGMQRLDVFAVRTFVLSTLTSAGQIAAVLLGGGLRAVVVVTVIVSVVGFVIFFVASRRLLPDISFRPSFKRESARELVSFGFFRFITQTSGQITTQFDPIVIAIFWPISAVGYYAVPLALTQKFHVVQDSVASAYFPAAVEIHASADVERQRTLYIGALKVVVVAMLFLIVVSVGYAQPILTVWVGSSVAMQAAAIFAVLAVGYGLSAMIGTPAQASDATGHQRVTAAFAVVSAVLQLGLALALVPRVGPIGAAIAVVGNTVTQGLVFVLLVQYRFMKVGLAAVFKGAFLRPLLAALALAVFVLLTRDHVATAVLLAACLVGGGALYAGLTLAFRVWSLQELDVLRGMLGGLRARLARPA